MRRDWAVKLIQRAEVSTFLHVATLLFHKHRHGQLVSRRLGLTGRWGRVGVGDRTIRATLHVEFGGVALKGREDEHGGG